MGNSVSRWFYKETEVRALMVGLDAAGKTTALYNLKLGEVVTTIPTIGFNVETIDVSGVKITAWDVGLRSKSRPLLRHYYQNTDAIVFIVDSTDVERMDEANELLWDMLVEDELRKAPLLVMANKQDLPPAITTVSISEKLGLNKLRDRQWYIIPTSATTGDGLKDGFEWLAKTLSGKRFTEDMKASVKTSVTEVKDASGKLSQNGWWYASNILTKTSELFKSVTGCAVKK